YTSPDLVTWTFHGDLALSSEAVIDACVRAKPGGGWRMWFKDEVHGNNIWCADSVDLYVWSVVGPALEVDYPVEGPYVFELAGTYWMIVDAKRQDLYRSADLETWERMGEALDMASGRASGRVDDLGPGLHGTVVVAGEIGWLVYFTHP